MALCRGFLYPGVDDAENQVDFIIVQNYIIAHLNLIIILLNRFRGGLLHSCCIKLVCQ